MRSEGFYPVVLATALLCLGWTVVVEPELYHSFNLLGRLPFSGQPQLPYRALQFGFVGAYWFILQDLTRRYFRQDLKTAAYVSASVRLVVVTITVATVALVPLGSPARLDVLAFFIGVFPQIGVQVLKSALGKVLSGSVPSLSARFPLSDLDGLTVWDQARLLEEGIEDMHALATANLVNLLLGTRVSGQHPGRLGGPGIAVFVRAEGARRHADEGRPAPARDQDCNGPDPDMELTRAGVRKHISAVFDRDEESGRPRSRQSCASIEGSPNLEHIEAFREHDSLPHCPGPADPAQVTGT